MLSFDRLIELEHKVWADEELTDEEAQELDENYSVYTSYIASVKFGRYALREEYFTDGMTPAEVVVALKMAAMSIGHLDHQDLLYSEIQEEEEDE